MYTIPGRVGNPFQPVSVRSRRGSAQSNLASDGVSPLTRRILYFRSLVSSIIGQQVSWLAARAIQHKFQRLFFPHLPEKRAPPTTSAPEGSSDSKASEETPFPTPSQVLALSDRTQTLRSAGLSGRKSKLIPTRSGIASLTLLFSQRNTSSSWLSASTMAACRPSR